MKTIGYNLNQIDKKYIPTSYVLPRGINKIKESQYFPSFKFPCVRSPPPISLRPRALPHLTDSQDFSTQNFLFLILSEKILHKRPTSCVRHNDNA